MNFPEILTLGRKVENFQISYPSRKKKGTKSQKTRMVAPPSLQLVEKLKTLRTKLSKLHDLPNYQIMNNRTIDELVLKRPQNKEALLQITGMGPVKVRRFGRPILETIRNSPQ
mgnify:CR=1 FL=1